MTRPLSVDRFPAFCGLLVGGSTLLQVPLRVMLRRLDTIARRNGWKSIVRDPVRPARFLAAFVAAWFSFQLLSGNVATQDKEEDVVSRTEVTVKDAEGLEGSQAIRPGQAPSKGRVDLAGKTLDLTLFAVIRAIDTLVGELWSRHRSYRVAKNRWSRIESCVSHLTDASIFAVSAGAVMWAWIYLPGRLPRAYTRWIADAAQVDPRLVETLRRVRRGQFVYGKNTGQAPLLQSMCRDHGWPLDWGDPAKTVPIPCEIVHMGVGPSCEKHAIVRFGRAFRFAFAMYFPLQLLLRMRSPSIKAFRQALRDAVRSSTFLGMFISIFYYSICLSRSRLGPKLISYDKITPMMWDQGLCINVACAMCGWSILLEAPQRRQEVALFVAPRALATILPRRYEVKVRLPESLGGLIQCLNASQYRWREDLAFAISTAVVFTCAQENPQRLRGVFGKLLNRVLNGS